MTVELTDHIRDKVSEALLISLPEDKLDELINAEINRFFHGGKDTYGRENKSEFSGLMFDELQVRAKKSILNWMDKNFERIWKGQSEQFIGKAAEAFVPIVLNRLGSGIVSEALGQIRQQLQGGY